MSQISVLLRHVTVTTWPLITRLLYSSNTSSFVVEDQLTVTTFCVNIYTLLHVINLCIVQISFHMSHWPILSAGDNLGQILCRTSLSKVRITKCP